MSARNRRLTLAEVERAQMIIDAALREVGRTIVTTVKQNAASAWVAYPSSVERHATMHRASMLALLAIDPERMVICAPHWVEHGTQATCRIPATVAVRGESCEAGAA